MKTVWFVKDGSGEIGPLSASALRRMADLAQINANTYVRRSEDSQWIRAERIKGLFKAVSVKPLVAGPPDHRDRISLPANSDRYRVSRRRHLIFGTIAVAVVAVTFSAFTLISRLLSVPTNAVSHEGTPASVSKNSTPAGGPASLLSSPVARKQPSHPAGASATALPSSREILDAAAVAAGQWDEAVDKDGLEVSSRAHLLLAIARAQASKGETGELRETVARYRTLKAMVKQAMIPLVEDQGELVTSTAIAYAAVGTPNAADLALKDMHEEWSNAFQPTEALADALAQSATAYSRKGDRAAMGMALDRLQALANEQNDKPAKTSILGKLGVARAACGAGSPSGEINALVGLRDSATALDKLGTLADGALGDIAVAQGRAGDFAGARKTLSKVDALRLDAVVARSRLAEAQAKAFDFWAAATTATEITNDFYRVRSLAAVLNVEVQFGGAYEDHIANLFGLVNRAAETYSDRPLLQHELWSGLLIARAKWEAALDDSSRGGMLGAALGIRARGQELPTSVSSVTVSEAAFEPERKVEIAVAKAILEAGKQHHEEAVQRVTEAFDHAMEMESREPQNRTRVLRQIGQSCVDAGCFDHARAWIEGQPSSLIRAAVLCGMAEGLLAREDVAKAAAEGLQFHGESRLDANDLHAEHQLWNQFVDAAPDVLHAHENKGFILVDGDCRILIVPTSNGIDFAIPPTLAGIKGYLAAIIAANRVLQKDEVLALMAPLEKPVGGEQTAGRFKFQKRLSSLPAGWIAVSLRQAQAGVVDRGTGVTQPVGGPDSKTEPPGDGKTFKSLPAASETEESMLWLGTRSGQIRDDNILKTKLVWIPAGDFTMGSPRDENDRGINEEQVQVTLSKGFWLGQHEVTQSEWRRMTQTAPWSGNDNVKEGDDYPATYVSWYDAMKFCEKLTEQERSAGQLPADWQYTLPTEAQWEYACRGGTQSRFSFGNDDANLTEYAWFDKNGWDGGERYAHLVGQKKPNPLGLFDMHGNVYEWCGDYYAEKLAGGTDPQGPSQGSVRVFRGGSWNDSAGNCRSAIRIRGTPDFRSRDLGFRVAAVPSTPTRQIAKTEKLPASTLLQGMDSNTAKEYGALLAGLFTKQFEDLPVKIDADVDKATGLVNMNRREGIIAIPIKNFKEDRENKAVETETGLGMCYLFMSQTFNPLIDGKPVDVKKLRTVKFTDADGNERMATCLLCSIKHVGGDDWQLYVYGSEKQPLLKAPFGEAGDAPKADLALTLQDPTPDKGQLVINLFGKFSAAMTIGIADKPVGKTERPSTSPALYANPYVVTGVDYDGYNYAVPIRPSQIEGGADDPFFTAARSAFYAGNYQEAQRQITQAITSKPHNTDVHQFHALVFFALGDYLKAAAVAHAVLESAPGWNWNVLQSFYASPDVYSQQLRALEQSINEHPNQAATRFLLGYHYVELGHVDAASRQFARAVTLEPRDKLAANLLARIPNPPRSQGKQEPPSEPTVRTVTTIGTRPETGRPMAKLDVPAPETIDAFAGARAGQTQDANGLKMKLVWCPPGEFTMGSPMDEKDRGSDENQVQVTLTKGFWLGQHEVTQAEWQRVMQSTPWSGKNYVKEGDDYPATFVTWDDATKFCEKLTGQEHSAGRLPSGWQYTLPTEAQWEDACRAGTKTRFSFGDDESDLGDYAWWGGLLGGGNAMNEQYAHLVGQKKANAWGLSDMHGNVWEWCRDYYAEKLAGGKDPVGPTTGSLRVFRGAGWYDAACYCRSAIRRTFTPGHRSSYLGFRVAAVPSSK